METIKTNMNEVRRLQKAAREGDKQHLVDWFNQFDAQVRSEYQRDMEKQIKELSEKLEKRYEHTFQRELSEAIENYLVAIVYALKFSELTNFGPKRIKEFMADVSVTIDMFTRKEYTPEEYKEILAKNGVDLFIKKEDKDGNN